MKVKDFIKTYWKETVIAILTFICIVLIMSSTCTNRKLNIAENNLQAMNDTLHTYVLKNGELMYTQQGYIARVDELEQYIGIQKKEVKELEKKLKSALATISKLEAQVKIDTVHMHDSVYITPDSVYHSHFNYSDKWLTMDGETSFQFDPFNTHTIINSIRMDVPLKIGTTADDKWFAVSDNPNVVFTSVEGANIEKAKPKKWSLGIQLGVGGVIGYGISGAKNDGIVRTGWFVGAGGYVGIGATYKLCEF